MSPTSAPSMPPLPGHTNRRWFQRLAQIVGLVLLGWAGWSLWQHYRHPQQPSSLYRTEKVSRGDLRVSITASGTLQPTRSVDVGSELSGTLQEVLVNDNDRVRQGQVLARLDTTKLQNDINKSRAALAIAQAAVQQMQASVNEAQAQLERLQHLAKLSGGQLPAPSELDSAQANLQRAQANLSSAQAQVLQAQASLSTDETNFKKAVIRAPIQGVVLARRVEPGQTVAASLNTPVLFTLAEDLTQMELDVKVDEADVAKVQLGQSASFTVSAWPGRTFPASLQRVGLGSTITDNVVTYKTVLRVPNPDLALRPGMTGTARIITAQRQQALLVPNAALRFTPPGLGEPNPAGPSLVSRLIPRPPSRARPNRTAAPVQAGTQQKVWVLQQGQPVPINITVGVTDGRQREVLSGDLQAGMDVITEYRAPKS